MVHIKDVSINTLAFAIYVAMHQIVIMPILSKMTDDLSFSKIIFFVSIFNIVTVITGDELGNTRLIRNRVYKVKNLNGDFSFILILLICVIILLSLFLRPFFDLNRVDYLLAILSIILGIIRYYTMSHYKLKQKFQKILSINLIYSAGVLLGFLLIY